MTVTASGGADRRNERALWLEAVRDVAPLRDRARPGPIPARPVAPPEKPSVAPPLPAASAGPGFARLADLDRATAERLKRDRTAAAWRGRRALCVVAAAALIRQSAKSWSPNFACCSAKWTLELVVCER